MDTRVWGEGVEALQVEVGFRSTPRNVHFWVFAFLRPINSIGILTKGPVRHKVTAFKFAAFETEFKCGKGEEA